MWALVCCVVAVVGAVTDAAPGCDVATGGDTYRRETLLRDIMWPSRLAVDYTNDTLYFSYNRGGNWTCAKLDLQTTAFSVIEELPGDCTFAVDRVRGRVYAGCRGDDQRGGGLHALDTNVGRFVLAGGAGRSVQFVYHHNDTLYYSFPDAYLLHAFRAGRSARVPEVTEDVRGLVVDGHGDWIYRNWTGLYRQRAGAAGATRYAGVGVPLALGVDARGAAYACDMDPDTTDGGMCRLHERAPSASRLEGVGLCTGLTFDRDNNIIYGDYENERIVRLVKC